MFQFTGGKKESTTCFATHGTMGHLDATQPPVRRKPYAALLAMPAVHKAQLVLPQELGEIVQRELARVAAPVYARVTLPLGALLEGAFFTRYVKEGDVIMLSEGVRGVDDVYSLRDGVLTLALGKEAYERAGLVGRPDGAKGGRGARARWLVEINLRLPSMLHGRKGFDRIVHACKTVLKEDVTWLFCNLEEKVPEPDPLQQYSQVTVDCAPKITVGPTVHVPRLRPPTGGSEDDNDFGAFATELYEWLSLIQLESPRVDVKDRIDPFLSRYRPPAPDNPSGEAETLMRISWEGFFSPSWAHKTFVQAALAATTKSWFAYAVSGFPESLPAGSRDCTILKIPGPSSEYMLWEVEQN